MKEYLDSEVIETENYYQIPGFVVLTPDDDSDNSIELPFGFQIKLYKSNDSSEFKNVISFKYEPNELIISQDYIIDQTDPTVVRRLFDAGFKYLKSPETLVDVIAKRLPSMDLVYIELMVQNMYRSKANPQNNARLTHYKDYTVYSQKQLPFLNSWVNSLSFENVDKGVKKALLTNQDIRYDPVEKIMIERYN